ncbi:flavodoxin [Actinoplanes sp. NPDC024001]|uniref:flavodoxin n=1 Tax=Actinoplanes sp. NPDC024001 TaxID=3154598 RepID=UPI0034020CB5
MLGLVAAGAAAFTGMLAVDQRNATSAGAPTVRPVRSPRSGSASAGPRGGETLVVFFSRAGENYPDLDLEIGNTAQIAGFIHDRVGGDLYEIVPAEPYPASKDETSTQAQREQDERVYPEIRGEVPDTDRYGTVFLGAPNWWLEQPMVVQTFMRDRDLGNATVIPFVTHDGSGFGNALDVLARYYPDAEVLQGFAERGVNVFNDPDKARTDVDAWLQGLGF